MTSLPSRQQIETQFSSHPRVAHIGSVYNICLEAESSATDVKSKIYSRILGYLILHAPSDAARTDVMQAITSCNDSSASYKLGEFYFNYFICAFRKYKPRTPAPSQHVSRPSFDTIKDMIKATLVPHPTNHAGAKVNALIRDGYRCMLSRRYDIVSVEKNTELLEESQATGPVGFSSTHCAHIFPECTNQDLSHALKPDRAASIWAVLTRFGYREIPEKLNGAGVHSLENAMTLDHLIHDRFDLLKVWFEETDVANQYRVRYARREAVMLANIGVSEKVAFTSNEPGFPLPSPTYLRIHAACAKVAHLSGAGEVIDQVLQDMELIDVLASDGSSADVLNHALLSLESMSVNA